MEQFITALGVPRYQLVASFVGHSTERMSAVAIFATLFTSSATAVAGFARIVFGAITFVGFKCARVSSEHAYIHVIRIYRGLQ